MQIGLLEDDKEQADVYRIWLEDAGYSLSHFVSCHDFLENVQYERYDLLLFDWLVPELSGIEVLKRVRLSNPRPIPVIFITLQDQDSHIVEALELGADDFMIKPITREVLIARIHAVTRRNGSMIKRSAPLKIPPYLIDIEAESIRFNGHEPGLTHKEFAVALCLFQNIGQIVSRKYLLQSVWNTHPTITTRKVDTCTSRIRTKLQLSHATGWQLDTIYGEGYRLYKTIDAV
ncbi:MAG: response regulator transcription factor [Gammaproteobacteria bacterium]|nr:response regulator transcription factor [Gammaproteobacteria bacterium]